MRSRVSAVGFVDVNTISNAGVLEIGDNRDGAKLNSRVLAVQRSLATFGSDEFRFEFYALFARPLPAAPPPSGTSAFFFSACAPIEIGIVDVTGVSAASHVRIGCGGPETAETRIVNIRNRIPGIQPQAQAEADNK
ncbi:spore germination protein GerPE [Cohnella rhizosphaerae]|uniref:Spore germination protein GerPE n=1 Tax=Cohnella rhizosphaerae TaxID=1457232 RepID=A0A9X4KXR5_9BACL|nr:spore germination protein GerPE [Cohnella rhizosphaerae]MDG0813229.1 spore germination protein GerPE [Cohnella rhizosphaerae]